MASLTLITKLPLGFLHGKCGDFERAVMHFPLAGYLSFAVWFVVYKLSYNVFSDSFIPVCLAMVAVYYFFNIFHFDGFLDSVDGLLSQKPKEEVLRIMKLGNIGPTALFAGAIYLILKVYLAVKLNIYVLLPVFVISRWGMSFAACISRPANETGLGSTITYGKPLYLAMATVYLVFFIFVHKVQIIGAMIAGVIVLDLILVKAIERRIGGLTGDNFGLINELNELLLMLTAFALS